MVHAQTTMDDTTQKLLAFPYYQLDEAERTLKEKGDCALSSLNFRSIKGAYLKSLNDINEKLELHPGNIYLHQTKVISLYGLSDCFAAKKNYLIASQHMQDAAETISKIIQYEGTTEKNKRELVLVNERLGVFAMKNGVNDLARTAFAKAVSIGEELTQTKPINYDDNKNLLINYVRLSKVSGNSDNKVKVLKEAACVASHIRPQMSEKDANLLFGGVFFELAEAQKLAGKPVEPITTKCKINPKATLTEEP